MTRLLLIAGFVVICGLVFTPVRRAEARATAKLAGDCVTAAPACEKPACPAPCITYRYRGRRNVCCGCPTPLNTVLQVKNPCTCCVVDVPVCLPGCCNSAPTVCCHRGLFGREIVDYDYCCGFRVRVALTRCGDINVSYIAR